MSVYKLHFPSYTTHRSRDKPTAGQTGRKEQVMKKGEFKNQLTATFWPDDYEELRLAKVGAKLIVSACTYEGPAENFDGAPSKSDRWELWKDNGEGIRRDFGYSDQYAYHGFLGAFDSWYRHGYGLRRVLDVEEIEDRWGNPKVRVRFGRDLVPDKW